MRDRRQEPAGGIGAARALAGCLGLLLFSGGLAGCGGPPVSPAPATSVGPPPAATARPVPAATPTTELVPLHVRFAGTIGCATFPYSCTATLSVLEPGADIPDAWRPPSSDPWWVPDYSDGTTAQSFDPTPLVGSPAATPGRHRLLVTLLGSYDTPSYGPDGSRAFDLLGRCGEDVEIRPGSGPVEVLVTFVPDPESFRATCSLRVGRG